VADAREPGLVQPVRLDEGDGDVAVEARVVGEVDLLARALPQEAADLVTTGGEVVRQGARAASLPASAALVQTRVNR
jgi:hypothetical protein